MPRTSTHRQQVTGRPQFSAEERSDPRVAAFERMFMSLTEQAARFRSDLSTSTLTHFMPGGTQPTTLEQVAHSAGQVAGVGIFLQRAYDEGVLDLKARLNGTEVTE